MTRLEGQTDEPAFLSEKSKGLKRLNLPVSITSAIATYGITRVANILEGVEIDQQGSLIIAGAVGVVVGAVLLVAEGWSAIKDGEKWMQESDEQLRNELGSQPVDPEATLAPSWQTDETLTGSAAFDPDATRVADPSAEGDSTPADTEFVVTDPAQGGENDEYYDPTERPADVAPTIDASAVTVQVDPNATIDDDPNAGTEFVVSESPESTDGEDTLVFDPTEGSGAETGDDDDPDKTLPPRSQQ